MSLNKRPIEFKWTSIKLTELEQAQIAQMSQNNPKRVWMNLIELKLALMNSN